MVRRREAFVPLGWVLTPFFAATRSAINDDSPFRAGSRVCRPVPEFAVKADYDIATARNRLLGAVDYFSPTGAGPAVRWLTVIVPLFSRMAQWTSATDRQPDWRRAALSSWWVSWARAITFSKSLPL